LRRRRGTEFKSGKNKVWEFYSKEEEQPKQHLWSKAIGHNDISGEGKFLQHTNNKRSQEFNLSKESEKQNINNRESPKKESSKTWWQTQSELCGVPNGVSYELDKDRANRIKSLGNSIVPQIARELGLAIMESENE